MNAKETERLLNDYIDGELSAEECANVEAMIEGDELLSAEERQLRILVEEARQLPSEVAPRRDLWPELSHQLEQGEAWCTTSDTTRWYRQPSTVAAALLMVIAGSGVFGAWNSGVTPDIPLWDVVSIVYSPEAGASSTVVASIREQEAEYIEAAQELRLAVEQEKRQLSPQVRAVVEDNLKILDEAIMETRLALNRNPEDERLGEQLLEMYQRQIAFLQKARSISTES